MEISLLAAIKRVLHAFRKHWRIASNDTNLGDTPPFTNALGGLTKRRAHELENAVHSFRTDFESSAIRDSAGINNDVICAIAFQQRFSVLVVCCRDDTNSLASCDCDGREPD